MVLKIMRRQHADKLWLFLTSPLTHACVVHVSFYYWENVSAVCSASHMLVFHRSILLHPQISMHFHQLHQLA